MPLNEFQKEQSLQRELNEKMIERCEPEDEPFCREITQLAANVAKKHFSDSHFGCFVGFMKCIVFVNMGPTNQHVRDRFRQRLAELNVQELSVAVSQDDMRYSWAV